MYPIWFISFLLVQGLQSIFTVTFCKLISVVFRQRQEDKWEHDLYEDDERQIPSMD